MNTLIIVHFYSMLLLPGIVPDACSFFDRKFL
jgi:hypothetical protein